jgi:hypothetical protein
MNKYMETKKLKPMLAKHIAAFKLDTRQRD